MELETLCWPLSIWGLPSSAWELWPESKERTHFGPFSAFHVRFTWLTIRIFIKDRPSVPKGCGAGVAENKIYFIPNNFPHFLEWACVVFIYSYKIYDYVQRRQMHILLLTKNHCFYLVVPISGPFSTHFVLYAWGLAARSSLWPQLATTPTATFRWRLFILSFYRYENRSSERLSNLSEVTQQWGGGGPDIWVHALKHPPVLLCPCKHNIAN